MLSLSIERYISLRQKLGYKLKDQKHELQGFGKLAESRGDDHITKETLLIWADMAPTAYARSIRINRVGALSRFLNAENNVHFVPDTTLSKHVYR